MISTRNLSQLPDVDRIRRALQAMAMLDAILCPEWELRYYSFQAKWSVGEQMGSMRNGSGDFFHALFNAAGCWLKGFAHEAPMSPRGNDERIWPRVIDEVPPEFAACLSEPAFVIAETTFCIWRRYGDQSWQCGHIDFPDGDQDLDGSEGLLSLLDGSPETYRAWAEEYYERLVDPRAVKRIFEHEPLTEGLVTQLNPELTLVELEEDAVEIGYPLASGYA